MQPARLGKQKAPSLLSYPEDGKIRATVIILPGGGVPYDKQWAAKWLPLGSLPALMAYVDLPLHGDRIVPDLRERHRYDRLRGFFAPAILGMAEEIPSIVDDLLAMTKNPSIEQMGLCGWSIDRMLGRDGEFHLPDGPFSLPGLLRKVFFKELDFCIIFSGSGNALKARYKSEI